MSDQFRGILHQGTANNFKLHKKKLQDNKRIEVNVSSFSESLDKESHKLIEGEFELLTRLAYCQSMLFKAWFEACDKLAKSAETTNYGENAKINNSYYIDTFEKVFTDLFSSDEFASSISKLLNAVLKCIREGSEMSQLLLGDVHKLQFVQNSNAINIMKSWIKEGH